MKHSLRRQMIAVFVGLIVCMLVILLLLVGSGLEPYYIREKEANFAELYDEIDQITRSGSLTEDELSQVNRTAERYNFYYIVWNFSNESGFSNLHDSQMLLMQLAGVLFNKIDSQVMERNDDYQVVEFRDGTQQVDYLASAGRIGLGWAESGGEAAGLVSTDSYLAADGIENVIRVLEDLEDEKYQNLDFVELNACAGGCVGGVLQVENPYIAKAKIKRMRRYAPVSKNHLSGSIPREMLWDTDLTYQPVLELGSTRSERFARYSRMEEILHQLPGLDCGSCGAPTCAALAEDVVRGQASVDDCTVLMRRRMEAVLRALGKDE